MPSARWAGRVLRRREKTTLRKKQMEIYRNEIEDMRRKVQMLENNRDSLEKFSREQFYFAAPGEDVFVVEE
jgi:cell division protein FtsB